jgi:DNA-binding response OmpR family regulator
MGSFEMNDKKILIVDDDPSIRKFLGANLTARGYQVLEAEGGPLALAILSRESVSLILLDIMMPEMDGFEVCRQIRKSSQTPILMLSAREGESDGEKCAACGANEYITKPFVLREILKLIQEMAK